jgi:lipoprotein-anchoring transpeptidase ErfK/SrfK
MSAWAQRRHSLTVLAGVAALGITMAGCSGSSSPKHDGSSPIVKTTQTQPSTPTSPTTPSPDAVLPATLTSSVKSAATGVKVDTPVSVSADNGVLKSVVFRDGEGNRLPGRFNKAHTTWTAAEFLDPDVQYTLVSMATNAEGKTTKSTRSFTTEALTLDQQTYPNVTPLAGSVMGIGMPVIVRFDIPVTDRAEMQKYMSVTSNPAQVGSWHWISSQEVHWRPRTYWQPGTKVHVDLNVNGVNAGNGIYGQLDRHIDFSIGQSVLIKANVASDEMQVYVGGSLARTIPITGGKPGGFETRSGIKLISEKYPSKRMNSATVGIDPNSPDGYNIANVKYAMRVTNSGEFLHAAPWSVYAQGHYNVSHGCVGMSTANAEWLYGIAEIGTPVQVTGSTRPIEPGNGWTDWDQSWSEYSAASAR